MSRPRPDGTSNGQCREETKRRWGRGNERGGAGARMEGRPGRVRRERGKRTDRAETNHHPLNERRPAARSDGKGGDQTTQPADREGEKGDNPGYIPTLEALCLGEVYGDWVHGNHGTHLDGSIDENAEWQAWWRYLAVMPSRRYDVPSGKVRRRFVETLGGELHGVRYRQWNLERFIVFHIVILKRARHVTASHAIRRRIGKRLDTWEAGRHGIFVEDTL